MATTQQGNPRGRDGSRIDVRLSVHWATAELKGHGEASDVSPHGLRIESEHPIPIGTELRLTVDTGDPNPAVADARVQWCRPHTTPTGRTVHDVGVQLDATTWQTPGMGKFGAALSQLFALQEMDTGAPSLHFAAELDDGTPMELVELQVDFARFRLSAPLGGRLARGANVTLEISAEGAAHRLLARVSWLTEGAAREDGTAPFGSGIGLALPTLDAAAKALLERVRVGQASPTRVRVVRA